MKFNVLKFKEVMFVLLYIYFEHQEIIELKNNEEDNLRFLSNYPHVTCVTVIGPYTRKLVSTAFMASGS